MELLPGIPRVGVGSPNGRRSKGRGDRGSKERRNTSKELCASSKGRQSLSAGCPTLAPLAGPLVPMGALLTPPPSAPALRAGSSERKRMADEGQSNQRWRQRHRLQPGALPDQTLLPATQFDESGLRFDRLDSAGSVSTASRTSPPRTARGSHRPGSGIIAEQMEVVVPVSSVEGIPVTRLWVAEGLPLDEAQAAIWEARVQDHGLRKARFFDRCLRADRDLPQPEELRRLQREGKYPHSAREARNRQSAENLSLSVLRKNSTEDFNARTGDPMSTIASWPFARDVSTESIEVAVAKPESRGDPMAGLVRSCSQAKLLPVTTGIIRPEASCLTLEHGFMTDTRAEVMAGTLRSTSSNVREAHLKSNGLSVQGARHLLSALPEEVEMIDLSQNNLGPNLGPDGMWCNALRRLTSLQSLSVSDSQIHDSACRMLCQSLVGCKRLTSIDLSGNDIYKGGSAIGSLVEGHPALTSLDVHWNHISGDAGRELARGIRENAEKARELQLVNLSWNPLGKACGEEACKHLAQAFRCTTLKHVDLKNCELTPTQCCILAEGLKDSTSILGLHIEGNCEAYVDAFGYLVVPEKAAQVTPKPVVVAGAEGTGVAASLEDEVFKDSVVELSGPSKSCCWLCDGWRETRLSYTPGISGPAVPAGGSAWVFTSADSFMRGTKLVRCGDELVAYLMAPRGQLQYIFQVGDELLTSTTARLAHQQIGFGPRRLKRQPVDGEDPGVPQEVDVLHFNSLQVQLRPEGEPVCEWHVPRRPGELNSDGGKPTEWHVERSLFVHFDNPLAYRGFNDRCFEADWRLVTSSALLVDEERASVKEFLKRGYGEVQSLYSSLCSTDWKLAQCEASERERPLCFGISLHEYSHFLVQGALLSDEVPLAAADAHFIIAATPPKEAAEEWHVSAQTGGCMLMRAGFLDVLVRMAVLVADSSVILPSKVLHGIFNKNLLAARKNNFRSVQWRHEVFHTEVVEAVYRKRVATLLRPLFRAFASAPAAPEQILQAAAEAEGAPDEEAAGTRQPRQALNPWQPAMTLEGWLRLLDTLSVLPCNQAADESRMNLWDRVWLWRASAMARFDETRAAEHLGLSFVEFLEAIGRLVALRLSRAKAVATSLEDAEKWDYGLGAVSPSTVFGLDKEGVMDKDRFAGHLEAFLSSSIVKSAVAKGVAMPA